MHFFINRLGIPFGPELHDIFKFKILSKTSTLTNLIEYYSYLNESFGNRCQVDAIYTDFSKAFDKVNQRILLLKLSHLGFRRETIIWLRSFLCDRWQQVRLGNFPSEPFHVTSGVPQGSHCGPLLFLLFMNDLSQVFHHCNFLFFADDLKLFSCIRSIQDTFLVQSDLDAFCSWCTRNELHLKILPNAILFHFVIRRL